MVREARRPSPRFYCSAWETLAFFGDAAAHRNGWPSGHATDSFFAAALLPQLLDLAAFPEGETLRRAISGCAWTLAAGICWARWALGCHTTSQILSGILLGLLAGVVFKCAFAWLTSAQTTELQRDEGEPQQCLADAAHAPQAR